MNRIKISVLFVLLTILGVAQNQQWSVILSDISFKIKNAGFTVTGKFTGLTSTIQFDGAKNVGNKIEASIDANTINTDNSTRDTHLKKEEYFSVEKFPKINMNASSFTKESEGKYKGLFTLIIKGVSKIVPVEFTFTEQDGKGKLAGSFTINRLDYQVGSSSLILSDNVIINIEVTCIKK